jgi:2,2-dialkylglycine decarboxylase (pyruvate)
MTSSEIEQTCYERGFLFFTTHVSDPLAASVALTVLDVVARDGLVQRAHDLGTQLQERLHSLVDDCAVVADARGRGLLQGIELRAPDGAAASADNLGRAVTAACLERGLHVNLLQLPGAGHVMRIAPPLTIDAADLHKGLDILGEALAEVAARTDRSPAM